MHTIYSLSRVILHAQLYPHPHEYPARSIHYYQTGAGALGVVYGDIGTSPLYALRECFHASHGLFVTTPSAPVRSFIFPLNRLSKSASWWKSSPHEPDAKAIPRHFPSLLFFQFLREFTAMC